MTGRALVLVAHGTSSPEGAATLARLRHKVAQALEGIEVRLALLDHGPCPDPVVSTAADPVLVPLFLGAGYHLEVDLPRLAALHDRSSITPALRGAPEIIAALASRVVTAGPARAVVLVAAGSSRPEARTDLQRAAALLAEMLAVPIEVAVLSGSGPSAQEAVHALGKDRRLPPSVVVLAPYLLTEGRFLSALAAEGAALGTRVGGPIGAHPAMVEAVVGRYAAITGPASSGPAAA